MICLSVSVFLCVTHQAEARLAAKRAARAEAREIRMRELERQQKEVSTQKTRLTRTRASDSDEGAETGRTSSAALRRRGQFGQHFLSNFLSLFRGRKQPGGSRVTGCQQKGNSEHCSSLTKKKNR